MDVILTSSAPEIDRVSRVMPEHVILKDPTLEQIFALCNLGYEPPHLNEDEVVMFKTRDGLPFKFPEVESIRHALAYAGREARPYQDMFKWFKDQALDILIQYGFMDEGEEEMYAFDTKVIHMEYRHWENLFYDRMAEIQEP